MSKYILVTDFIRPPMNANQQKRAHFHEVAKAKKLVGNQVRDLALERRLVITEPVIVEVIWFVPDKRKRDTDGLSVFLKAALDGLVQAGALEDDHSDFVPRTCMSINKFEMDRPRIEVAITEMR